ncbi:HNH endonuclease [Citrobacter koseri]|uniref:HNH endonuclease n=1 Tax=Citrobacter koseri TaxID=545 RepID=UPI0025519C07|nr:HNH endonuclease [Citrobacter koseri]MEC5643164.1 HNH endonuclease [Citrobacter koseri]
MKMNITQPELISRLSYDPDSGIFTWKGVLGNRFSRVGHVAGTINGRGYIQIGVGGKLYLAHRLAWLYMTGTWPKLILDHVDGNPLNNRFSNLRDADYSQNMCNKKKARKNTSGYRGVVWCGRDKKWVARGAFRRKAYTLGRFENIELAALVAQNFREKYHLEFTRNEP